MGFAPFEVRMRLAAPVALGFQRQMHPVHFDGFFLHVLASLEMSPQERADIDAVLRLAEELPFLRSGEEFPFYHASAWELPGAGMLVDAIVLSLGWKHWLRGVPARGPKGDFWSDGSGVYRAAAQPLVLAAAKEAVFRACGDADLVEAKLREYHRRFGLAVGVRTGSGYGAVSDFEVVRLESDASVFVERRGPDGAVERVPARYVPLPEARRLGISARFVAAGAFRPPYWQSAPVACAAPEPSRWYPPEPQRPFSPRRAATVQEYLESLGIAEEEG